jgi:hypothetical protein
VAEFNEVRIYAAGKITKNGWRHKLFPVESGYDYSNSTAYAWPDEIAIPGLPGAVYVGPHFLSDDHGCFHGENLHGVAAGSAACGGVYPGLSRPDVAKRCLAALEEATHVFVWIDDPSAYGTLVEIGYARALGKQVHVYVSDKCDQLADLWFAGQIASAYVETKDYVAAWEDFCLRLRNTRSILH